MEVVVCQLSMGVISKEVSGRRRAAKAGKSRAEQHQQQILSRVRGVKCQKDEDGKETPAGRRRRRIKRESSGQAEQIDRSMDELKKVKEEEG